MTEFLNHKQLLRNYCIESVIMTAGAKKRTVTVTGTIVEAAKAHVQKRLEAIHRSFIQAVTRYRKVDESIWGTVVAND